MEEVSPTNEDGEGGDGEGYVGESGRRVVSVTQRRGLRDNGSIVSEEEEQYRGEIEFSGDWSILIQLTFSFCDRGTERKSVAMEVFGVGGGGGSRVA